MRVPYSNEHAAYLALGTVGALGTATIKGTVWLMAAPVLLPWRAVRATARAGRRIASMEHHQPEPGWWGRQRAHEQYVRDWWAWRAECDRIHAAWLAQRGAS